MKTLMYLPNRNVTPILFKKFFKKYYRVVFYKPVIMLFLLSLLCLQACYTRKSILQNTSKLEARGLFCEAISQELVSLADDYSPERDATLARVGEKCVELSIYQANTIFNAAVLPQDFITALTKCDEARSKINNLNSDFKTSILQWKKEYQVLEDRIKQGLQQAYYSEAVVSYSQKDYKVAIEKFDKLIALNPTYKDCLKLRKESVDAILEQKYQIGISLYQSKNYDLAISKIDEVLAEDASYKDAANTRKVIYEAITEQLYQVAVSNFDSKNYHKSYEITEQVIARNPSYKEVQRLKQESYNAITEEIYSNGLNLFKNGNYNEAYSNMNTVISRNPSYKEALQVRKESYDKISEKLFNDGNNAYNNRNYRQAYKIFHDISQRDDIHTKYPNLAALVSECKEKSILKFYFEGEPNITNEVYNAITRHFQNSEFISFVGSPSQADYVVVISNEVSQHSPKTTRNPKTAYRIRRWQEETLDTTTKPPRRNYRSKYDATEPVTYYEVQKQNSVTCKVGYSIRGAYGRGRNFEATKSECLNYNECNHTDFAELSHNRCEATYWEIKPDEHFTRKFLEPNAKGYEALRNEACRELIKNLIAAITKDINEINRTITN